MKKELFFCVGLVGAALSGEAAILSFQVDPDVFDTAPDDGFIMGTEFSPTGSDGTLFTFTPTNNLVGFDRLLLSPTTGLQVGGGGGSTLSFSFETNQPIELNSYTLSSSGFFLGSPTFDVSGTGVSSLGNDAFPTGSTINFDGGPLVLEANTTYDVSFNNTGAAVQAFIASWNYSTVPESSSTVLIIGILSIAFVCGRRRLA